MMKKSLLIVIIVVCAVYFREDYSKWFREASHPSTPLVQAIEQKRNDTQVEGQGVVIKILPDDTEGRRHQKFIVQLQSGQTLLIAHNIDLAPRLTSIRVGDQVEFAGEYEWNPQGGVVHWTHRDPKRRHPGGWIKHRGQLHQ